MKVAGPEITLRVLRAPRLDGHARLIDGVDEAILPQGFHHGCIVLGIKRVNVPGEHKEGHLQRVRDNGILI